MTLLLMSACASDPKKVSFDFEAPDEFSANGVKETAGLWWEEFQDSKLNEKIRVAFENNFSLASSWQRLQAAKALASGSEADLFPKLNAVASAESRNGREWEEGNRGEDQDLQVGLEASYEVDLWGRIRSLSKAEEYRALASYASYQTAAMTLSAEVARTWYGLIEAKRQLELAKKQFVANEDILSVLKARFGNGLIRSSDILRQRQLVESTHEQVIAEELRVELLGHQLALLLGKPPKKIKTPNGLELVSLPATPKTGVPAELVKRRPDVREAWLRVQSANQEVAAAISNRYPRINLSASYLTQGENSSLLFSNWISSITGSLLLPLIDGGDRAARVDRSRAVEKQRVHEYAQAVLNAFREVEDALVREQKQRERKESLEKQVELTERTYKNLRREYFNGANDYTSVLGTLTELQQLQRDLLSADRSLIESRISLYRALAGGFKTPREKSVKENQKEER